MRALFLLALLSVLTSCTKNNSDCTSIEYNKAFIAEVGEQYCVDDKNYVRIDKVDNQLCPCNADCIWEGEFIVNMSVTADGKSYEYSFGSSEKTIDEEPFDFFKLKFLSITPNSCDSDVQKDFRVGFILEKD